MNEETKKPLLTPNNEVRITVPRGIEVLLKKAAVDSDFRQLLLDRRGSAAAAIGLELAAGETAVLNAIPAEQLVNAITHTVVPIEQRRVFLGRVAAAMLALVGVGLVGCEPRAESAGVRPDRPGLAPGQSNDANSNAAATQVSSTNSPAATAPPVSRGISPDRP